MKGKLFLFNFSRSLGLNRVPPCVLSFNTPYLCANSPNMHHEWSFHCAFKIVFRLLNCCIPPYDPARMMSLSLSKMQSNLSGPNSPVPISFLTFQSLPCLRRLLETYRLTLIFN